MCAGKDTHSEKTWEDSKLSPSAIADPQGEQEVKAKSESWMITKHWRKGGLQKLEEFSFFLFFFPSWTLMKSVKTLAEHKLK